MKMAENSVVLTFQNNCDSINSKCVEVMGEDNEKITNNDITDGKTHHINKQEDEPADAFSESVSSMTPDDAVDVLLAGEDKTVYGDDLLLANIVSENDGIEFKTDNVIVDCQELETLEKSEFSDTEIAEDGEDEKVESPGNSVEEDAMETENVDHAEGLTKMQIMEDVREGCSVQPSSPGHAEERVSNEDEEKVASDVEENGFEDEISVNGNDTEDKSTKEATETADDDKSPSETQQPEPEKAETETDTNNHVTEENCSSNNSNTSSEESQTNKRKAEASESSSKRLHLEIQDSFLARDKILNDFIEMSDCNTVEQYQIQTEQILAEIRTLNDLAKEKEREWNNILHLKKMKEELLLRMQRRKQVLLLTSDKSENGDTFLNESQGDSVADRLKNTSNQSILKTNLTHPGKSLRIPSISTSFDKNFNKHRSLLARGGQQYAVEMNGSLDFNSKQSKQRQMLDVQSIIADYRQRHPETVPRRGRRIRGSGSQVHHNIQGFDASGELGILLHAMDSQNRSDLSRSSGAESSGSHEPSFKDMLVQLSKLSQSERNELIQNAIKPPPPYPEVTVHPVPTAAASTAPTNSLLHGILTKSPSKTNTKTSFSPTLARLLTAPERGNGHVTSTPVTASSLQSTNMSISEILSTSKARNEITITPVGGAPFDTPVKGKSNSQAEEEEPEAEDSADRLVIDESTEGADGRGRGDASSDGGDEVPQCQGCNQKSALFVCAGCGNQWYCSRDCQVSAWDEHSEVCSG